MPSQLLWFVVHPMIPFGRLKNKVRQESYQAPSWSWASIDGDVMFPDNAASMEALAEYVEGNVELSKTGKFGAVSNGYIRIRGYLSQAEFVLSDELLREVLAYNISYCSLVRSEEGLTVGLTIYPDVSQDGFTERPTLPPTWNTQLINIRQGLGSRMFFILPL
jgi:hypothetical protein